jgi:hypothetical protein
LTTSFSDFSERNTYRSLIAPELAHWQTQHKQTELFVCAEKRLENLALQAVMQLRAQLDAYIARHPAFAESFVPLAPEKNAPDVVCQMCIAAKAAAVGPMAAVAGAFAVHVGRALLAESQQVIVENGGDIFLKTDAQKTVAIYAGQSPLSMKMGIVADTRQAPLAICTSAGTVGPSVSFGHADAAVVVSRDACLADACATRLGNEIKTAADIERALALILNIEGVTGAVAVLGDVCGASGDIQLVTLPAAAD